MTENKNQQQQTDKNGNSQDQSGKSTPNTGNMPHKPSKHAETPDADHEEPVREADFNPDKSAEIGDDPEQTKKKIPNMQK